MSLRTWDRLGRGAFVALAGLLATLAQPAPARAQLRPYEPADWELFQDSATVTARLGGAAFSGQRASLAGEVGWLGELGMFSAAIRTGRVAITASGTLLRVFSRDDIFAPPHGGAHEDADGYRHDAGDYRIATTVRLTPQRMRPVAVLRFGTRLPTTDNGVGLERDQIDFFALLGAHLESGPYRATAETGVGIHGTRNPGFEQSDVLVYIATAGLPRVALSPTLVFAGHADGLRGRNIAGNEELAEVRLRLRTGGRLWIQAEAVRGLMEFSPDWGVSLSAGTTR